MQGLGNDFMVLDLVTNEINLNREQIRQLADRRYGVGFDQLLQINPPASPVWILTTVSSMPTAPKLSTVAMAHAVLPNSL